MLEVVASWPHQKSLAYIKDQAHFPTDHFILPEISDRGDQKPREFLSTQSPDRWLNRGQNPFSPLSAFKSTSRFATKSPH